MSPNNSARKQFERDIHNVTIQTPRAQNENTPDLNVYNITIEPLISTPIFISLIFATTRTLPLQPTMPDTSTSRPKASTPTTPTIYVILSHKWNYTKETPFPSKLPPDDIRGHPYEYCTSLPAAVISMNELCEGIEARELLVERFSSDHIVGTEVSENGAKKREFFGYVARDDDLGKGEMMWVEPVMKSAVSMKEDGDMEEGDMYGGKFGLDEHGKLWYAKNGGVFIEK
ncbi:hypothetical protein P280DRAFT_478574 [Massarina eburnea CBS 473.64]|uniref:Uncharacterized protein n=1 Tax=Massarina eburnea CBS 473.64 TaxID=1395130 RepID=A0A6A6S4F1_9PLEO|nr:hypothetical protein P280DRAFT_478574 [Massarina eburnea CBS 473.64]